MSYLTQMMGLTVQNFLSAASGMAVLAAFIRGLVRSRSETIGNFLAGYGPHCFIHSSSLALILSLLLVSQGVVQSLSPTAKVPLLQKTTDSAGRPITEQAIPLGPAASQIAIKQIGTNGGRILQRQFGASSGESNADFELPRTACDSPASRSTLLHLREDGGRHASGWAILAAMLLIFLPFLLLSLWSEQAGTPALSGLGIDQAAEPCNPAGTWRGRRPVSESPLPSSGQRPQRRQQWIGQCRT